MKMTDVEAFVQTTTMYPELVVFGRHLSWPDDEQKICIVRNGSDVWQVYALDHGQITDLHEFANEELACDFLFEFVKESHALHSPRR